MVKKGAGVSVGEGGEKRRREDSEDVQAARRARVDDGKVSED